MHTKRVPLVPLVSAILLLPPSLTLASEVHPIFDLSAPLVGPFPSDRFTVRDPTQNTGLRVNLPLPDCSAQPSDCEDLEIINTLDGFNLQPRLSIPFDGPIDVRSVSSQTVFLIRLENSLTGQDGGGHVVGINQIVWDPSRNTLHVESDELLDQHTRYALIVTGGLRDPEGMPVEASGAFQRFRHDLNFGLSQDLAVKSYRKALLHALSEASALGVESDIVAASVFTTQSTTATLEKIRDQIHAATPAPADFLLGTGGERTVFALDDVTGIALRQQVRVEGPLNAPLNVNLPLLRIIPGAVGRIAFGKYVSPEYRVHPGGFIPAVGTRTGTPMVQGTNEVYFSVALPSGAPPADGWPVAVFGIPGGANKEGELGLPSVAATMAEQGVATVAINIVGHGFGALGTLTVSTRQAAGSLGVTLPAGGRGIDQNADGLIERREGITAARPRSIIEDRDGFRQTVADLMQLVRTIEVGMDVDGDGAPELDASRIYYFGPSLGGMYGSAFLAVEPNVRTGVLNVPGGPRTSRVLNNNGDRPLYGSYLAARVPSLINAPGVTQIDEVPIAGLPRFTENMPLRDGLALTVGLEDGTTRVIRSPVVNDVPGAIDIQELLERAEWVIQSGNPVAYSPYLRKAPLAGVPAKSILIQFAKGDQTTPNPATTAMLRAGDLADRAMFYRHDLASAERPTLPKNPHVFMVGISAAFGFLEIGLPVQRQIAIFFASDGGIVIHPEPARFFELPITGPLPEDLNYVR
jgi:Bacterial virulence factor lipase N-terminal